MHQRHTHAPAGTGRSPRRGACRERGRRRDRLQSGQDATGTRTRFPRGLGSDFTGRVAAVGSDVRAWKVGAEVWGLMPHFTFGAIADYVAVPEQRLARAPRTSACSKPRPPGVGHHCNDRPDRQSATPVRGTAPGPRSHRRSRQRHRATGQGPRRACHSPGRRPNLDWITQLGADETLNYRTTRPDDLDRFDVIVDVVGTDLGAYQSRLTHRGRLIALAFDPDRVVSSMLSTGLRAATTPRRIKMFSNNPPVERIAELTRAAEAGTIRPMIDTVFPMHDIAAVHHRLETGGVRGKHVINMQRL